MKKNTPKSSPAFHHLETLTLSAVQHGKRIGDQQAKLYWRLYSELAEQRANVAPQLLEWLCSQVKTKFMFSDWQRIVRFQFSNDPLSTVGSLKSLAGGRFNIGDLDRARFPSFPCLYLASDRETALTEAFGPNAASGDHTLTPLDHALASNEPFSCLTIRGSLAEYVDLTQPHVFAGFLAINNSFKISKELRNSYRALGLTPPTIVTTEAQLLESILMPSWRYFPVQLGTPSNSQLLGQMICNAGIQGIVYPSSKNGKKCLAVFPQNFAETDSFVELVGALPDGVKVKRLDGNAIL